MNEHKKWEIGYGNGITGPSSTSGWRQIRSLPEKTLITCPDAGVNTIEGKPCSSVIAITYKPEHARRIVHCCNNFDDLLAACKHHKEAYFERYVKSDFNNETVNKFWLEDWPDTEQAISQAEEIEKEKK